VIGEFGGSLPQLITQAEAEAGTVTSPRTVTPESMKQAIDVLSALGLVTTKGDILVRNGTKLARLAVGTNGQQLEADSAEATGAKWKTPIRFFDFPYRATTNTQTPPPNSGRLIWNNSDQTAATELFISTTTDAGSSISELLELLAKQGVQVDIFDRSDLSLRITYTMTADGTDNGTYFTIPVSFDDNTTTFSNNQNLTVVFNTGSQTPQAVLAATTKGDILVRNNTELVRLPIGPRSFFLRSDPDEPIGVKWASQQNFFTQDYTWKTDLGTPGNGDIKGNNADQTLITILRISKTNGNNQTIGAILELLLLTNTKLGILDESTPGNFNYYQMTVDAVDQGTYFDCTVTFLQTTTTHGNNAKVVLFINTGAQLASTFSTIASEGVLVGHGLELIRLNAAENKFEFIDFSMDDIDETATKKILTAAERTKLGNLNDGYKGFFTTPAALTTAFPTASNGDFATVGSTDTIWAWDGDTAAWVDTDSNSLGDMLKTTYDPTSINGDAFDMANMVESANEKIFTNAERTKLGDIENNATQDQSNSEIETAYNAKVSVVSQAEAEAGTSTTVRRWTAERVKQAIEALMTEVVPNINFSFTGENGDGAETKSATYETVAAFIFEGSAALAAITSIKAIASADGSTSADIRIFDATNSLVIADLTGFTNATPEIIDLGSISNVPTGEALFELQLLRDGGGGDRGLCSSLQVKF